MAGRQCGFSYIGLLVLVALLSTALAGAGELWRTQARREREAMLLFHGRELADAITAYHDHTPAGRRAAFPQRLDDLLDDRRWPTTRRHLRRIPLDPMTGRAQWGLEQGPDGGIVGVHSLSRAVPLKRAGFAEHEAKFAEAATVGDWHFVYRAPASAEN